MPFSLEEMLRQVNVPGTDNGKRFVNQTRRNAVEAILARNPRVSLFHRDDYVMLYATGTDEVCPVVLVSCHLDHVFSNKRLGLEICGDTVTGSLDNAATIACLLYALQECAFPRNVLVTFTGGEETGCYGARKTATFLKKHPRGLIERIAAVVVTDITADNYPLAVSFENVHFRKPFAAVGGIAVDSHVGFCRVLVGAVRKAGIVAGYVADAMPDESGAYARRGLNTVSLCLPCDCPRGDVHSVRCRVKLRTMQDYARALAVCVRALGGGSSGTDGS